MPQQRQIRERIHAAPIDLRFQIAAAHGLDLLPARPVRKRDIQGMSALKDPFEKLPSKRIEALIVVYQNQQFHLTFLTGTPT